MNVEQLLKEIEMLDALECYRNSHGVNFTRLINGGESQRAALAKCRHSSEVILSLNERIGALNEKHGEKKVRNDFPTLV